MKGGYKINFMELSELEYVASGGPTEAEMDKLNGTKVKIAKVEIIDDTTVFAIGKDGKSERLPEGQERAIKRVQLTTEEFGQSLIGRSIVHIQKYDLKEKNGKWIVSLHEKSNTGNFLSVYKLDKFENAKGKEVVLVKKPISNTGKNKLAISI